MVIKVENARRAEVLKNLKEADDASAGDEITVRLGRGELDCRVDAVRRSPEQAGAGRETG